MGQSMFTWTTVKYVDEIRMPETYAEKLQKVMDLILPVAEPYATEIILFGSTARGRPVLESDLDVMIIIPDEYAEIRRELSVRIEMTDVREDTGLIPVDVFVRTQKFMDSEGWFQENVRKDKKVLWGKSDGV